MFILRSDPCTRHVYPQLQKAQGRVTCLAIQEPECATRPAAPFTIEGMGRQTQLHVLSRDLNELLVAMHDKEPMHVALRRGNSATLERQSFIPDNLSGQSLVLWSERFAPDLQRRFVATADSPYFLADEQTESVLELSLSAVTTWEGRPALTQGRIYGVFRNKQPEFEKCYEQIIRYIRGHWRKNPATWMGGYVGPAAGDWFDGGGLLLPSYVPPVCNDWIQRLDDQHPAG